MAKEPSRVTPTGIAVALAVVVALGFLFLGPSLFAPLEPVPQDEGLAPALPAESSGELMVTDIQVGTGAAVAPGSKISVHYTGTFENGQVFDSSLTRGTPFTFTLGVDPVIQGWEQGLVGMKVGGKRHLVIPPELGYGPNDYGSIPGGSTLIFDVELLGIEGQ